LLVNPIFNNDEALNLIQDQQLNLKYVIRATQEDEYKDMMVKERY
jgi:hypothetical protein